MHKIGGRIKDYVRRMSVYRNPFHQYQWFNHVYYSHWGNRWNPQLYAQNYPVHNPYYDSSRLKDYGPNPFVININDASMKNNTFRTVIWTGDHLQLTLMSINVGEDIGLENHPNLDQFLRIEEGQGVVQMGKNKQQLDFQRRVHEDSAIVVPAGTWHNLINTGNKPLKLYSIYTPPQHPPGTVHETKANAMAAEENHQ
jgi:mannose-6-phosphate isomerase-like protein (cupin superfamily)